jgi:hypothetical protein
LKGEKKLALFVSNPVDMPLLLMQGNYCPTFQRTSSLLTPLLVSCMKLQVFERSKSAHYCLEEILSLANNILALQSFFD